MERRAEKLLQHRLLAPRAVYVLLGASLAAMTVVGSVYITPASADDTPEDRSPVTRMIQERQLIPFDTIRKPTADLRLGAARTIRPGVPGTALVTYRVRLQGGKEIGREVVSRQVERPAVAEVIQIGTAPGNPSRGRYASRGYFAGRRVLTMIATGYDPSPASNGGYSRTSTGLRIGHGVVAVDPRVIPIGTKLYIEGYGYAVAADVGGAIKGNRIDLGHDSARGARNIGRRIVRVHILD